MISITNWYSAHSNCYQHSISMPCIVVLEVSNRSETKARDTDYSCTSWYSLRMDLCNTFIIVAVTESSLQFSIKWEFKNNPAPKIECHAVPKLVTLQAPRAMPN